MKRIATTVKIVPSLYDEFKVLGIRYRLTLQTLVEKCVNRYVSESLFRDGMNEYVTPDQMALAVSGSATLEGGE